MIDQTRPVTAASALSAPVRPESASAPRFGTTVVRPQDGVAVLEVDGEVDTTTAPELEAALTDYLTGPNTHVVVDMTGVTFLASSGLAVLIRGARRAAERERRIQLVTAARTVRRPLEITGVSFLFDLHADLPSALGGSD